MGVGQPLLLFLGWLMKALNQHPVSALAQRLGISERHLDRVFMQVLGATPLAIARFKRAQLARQLLTTNLPLAQIAEHAGYGSVSQFSRELKRFFQFSPSQLRKGRGRVGAPLTLNLLLPVRQPYDFEWIFNYLRIRALAGIETVQGYCYRRKLPKGQGSVVVRREGQNLRVHLPLGVNRRTGCCGGSCGYSTWMQTATRFIDICCNTGFSAMA